MQTMIEHEVSRVESVMKIREYLKRRLGFSTSLIAKVKYDMVFLNGVPVHMRAEVKNGDIIKVVMPSEDSECVKPISFPLDIIYEDDYILAVNKPRNMPVHPSLGNHLPTLAEGVRAYLDRPFVFRAVNRLDRDTSGIVVIAKNQLAAGALSQMIKNGGFTKKYVAQVCGIPSPETGIIDAPIERVEKDNIKRTVRTDGKQSITKYKVICKNPDGTSILELEPVTGRTHQLRVHLSYIGHPLVNDFLYGTREADETYRLHCCYLGFTHPFTKSPIELYAKCDFYNISAL